MQRFHLQHIACPVELFSTQTNCCSVIDNVNILDILLLELNALLAH
jgi:hypothetical protein